MRAIHSLLWAGTIAALLAACGTELERTNPYDANTDTLDQARGAVTGRVFLEGESDHAAVEIRFDGPSQTDISTRADGSYEINQLIPGSYQLTLSERGWTEIQSAAVVDIAGTLALTDVTLALREAGVTGSLATLGGSSTGGARVSLLREQSPRGTSTAAAPDFHPAASTGNTGGAAVYQYQAFASADGTFQFNQVAAGTYRLTLQLPGTRSITLIVEISGDQALVEIPAVVLEASLHDFTLTGTLADGNTSHDWTAQRTVELSLQAQDVTAVEVGLEDGSGVCRFEQLHMYAATLSYQLPDTDDLYTLCLRYIDSTNGTGETLRASIVLDRSQPSLSLARQSPTVTNQPTLNLTLQSADAVRYRIGEALPLSAIHDYSSSTVDYELLDQSDGSHTVYVSVMDQAGNASVPVSTTVVLDRTQPSVSIALDGTEGIEGRTANQSVTLSVVSVSSDAVAWTIANQALDDSEIWQPLVSPRTHVLTSQDGVKTVYVKVRDGAGNESTVATANIELDQTPSDPPALQLDSIDSDGFSLSATSVELRWTQPTDAAPEGFELQRFVEGLDSDFSTLVSLPYTTLTYVDNITAPGYTHRYRIRAVDELANRSAFSLEIAARPFAPINELYQIEGLTEDLLSWNPYSGVFQLQGSLLYYDVSDGSDTSVDLGINGLNYVRDLTQDWYNSFLRIRQWNQDSSLLYESDFDLGWPKYDNNIETVPIGYRFESKADTNGHLHVMYQSGASGLSYARETDGQWSYEVINANSGGYQINMLFDSGGVVHAANSWSGSPPTPTPPLYYRKGNLGNWTQELVTYGDSRPAMTLASNGDLRIVSRVNRWTPSLYNKIGYYRRLASNGTWRFNELMSLDPNTYLVQREVAMTRVGSTNYINYRMESGASDSWIANTSGEFGSWVTSYPVYIATLTDYDLRRIYDGDEHFLVYENPVSGKLIAAVSTSGTGSWTSQDIAADGYSSEYESFGLATSDGVVYVAYLNTSKQLWLAHNAHGTWYRQMLASGVHLGSSVSISTEQGRLFVTAYNNSVGATYYSLRQPKARRIYADGEIKDLYYDDLNRLHILVERTTGGLYHLWNNAGTWQQQLLSSNNVGSACIKRYGTTNAIFYYDETADQLRIYKHTDSTAGSSSLIYSGIPLDSGIDAGITTNGTAHVVIGEESYRGSASLNGPWTQFANAGGGMRPKVIMVSNLPHVYSSNAYSVGETYFFHDAFNGSSWSNTQTRIGAMTGSNRPVAHNGHVYVAYSAGGSTLLDVWNATSGSDSEFLSSQSSADGVVLSTDLNYHLVKRNSTNIFYETSAANNIQNTQVATTAGTSVYTILNPVTQKPVLVYQNGGVIVLEGFSGTVPVTQVQRATTF